MSQEKFNLNWNSYTDHLREMLQEMMKTTELTDVTLVCDDKTQFKAHKIVLSACSSFFKSIISDLPVKNSVIYLRGIQHQEMESILEFMYLGVASINQERLNEFLDIAKNLKIKELSKTVKYKNEKPEINEIVDNGEPEFAEFENKNVSTRKPEMSEYMEFKNENVSNEKPDKLIRNLDRLFDNKDVLTEVEIPDNENEDPKKHIESKHNDVKYDCNYREYQAACQSYLKSHVQSKHESMKYVCNQCDQQFTVRIHLKRHIRTMHDGNRFDCDQCGYHTVRQSHLTRHIQSMHEGIKFPCNKCDYQATRKDSLKHHFQLKHKDLA